MNENHQVVTRKRNKRDLPLLLFILYVTPLCVYLQSLFFATTNAWGAMYIIMMAGLMLISGKFSMQAGRSDTLFFIFILVACYASLRAGEYLYFMQAFLVFIFVWGYRKYDLGTLYKYLNVLVAFGVICAFACIIQTFWNGFYTDFVSRLFKADELDIISRLGENKGKCGLMPQTANAASCILNAFFILMLKNNAIRKRIVLGVILAFGLLLTGKRAHLFMGAFVFFLSFFIGFEGRKAKKKLFAGMVAVLALVGGLFAVVPFLSQDSNFVMGLNTIQKFDLNDGEIMHGRELLYVEAILMGESAPLTGHGWGSFKKTVSYRGGNTDVHNIYLQLFAEQGIIVMTLFIIAAIVLVSSSIKVLKKLRRVCPEYSKEVILTKLAFYFILFFYLYGLTGNGLYNVECLLPLGLGVSILKRVNQVANI